MPGSPRKIILDTDPGVDDVLAILLALASPEVDVRLISIVFGNTHAPVAHSNLLKIYHLLASELVAIPEAAIRYGRLEGQEGAVGKTVVAVGRTDLLEGRRRSPPWQGRPVQHLGDAPSFHSPERDPTIPHQHLDIDDRPSYEVMLEILRTEPENSVTIVALGPLTNLAHAFRADPTTFARVAGVVWMGGALDVPGNTSPVSEFNCFADPFAAEQILTGAKEGKFELIMAPLDITTPHQVPFSDLIHPSIAAAAAAQGGPAKLTNGYPLKGVKTSPTGEHGEPTPIQAFVGAMLLRVRGLQASFGLPDAMEMHDPVAVWFAIAHAGATKLSSSVDGWGLQKREFRVERVGEITRGMCVVDRRGTGEDSHDRTKDEKIGKGGTVPSLQVEESSKEEGKEDKKLPWVIVKTPGSEPLRKMILGRVFGTQV
ncbi:hypothetical protein EHS25_006928 [Saitozyma podzolica]|uniref:Inosine/uridine-preferring nucleoside hydrolase domain-containing protein n=1 Tax=Saitozyma podzolica TaxID=1890683 RepID=A0A427XRB7_9TREE|nr:hypothetical protein EHS25_006928 [Saitozyma podzolica]